MIYVMSDIHGNMRRFNSIMEQIQLQPEDTLYVLGDVIDRHPDGIRILCKLMKIALLEEYVKSTAEEITGKGISCGMVSAGVFTLSQVIFGGVIDAFIWLEGYRYYLILPCVVLPLIEGIVSRIKRKP